MSSRAFILVGTEVGKIREVAEALRNLGGMVSVDMVTGPYDVIATVEAADMNAIGAVLTEKVHTISGVVRTVTCVAVGG